MDKMDEATRAKLAAAATNQPRKDGKFDTKPKKAPIVPTASPVTGGLKENPTVDTDESSSTILDLYNNNFLAAKSSNGIVLPEDFSEQLNWAKNKNCNPAVLDIFSTEYHDLRENVFEQNNFVDKLEILEAVASNPNTLSTTLARLALMEYSSITLIVASNPNTDRETLAYLMAGKELRHDSLVSTDTAIEARKNWLGRLPVYS